MSNPDTPNAPDVLMLMASGCAFCPGVLKTLQELESEGVIGHVEAINISQHPEIAQQYGVRSVPFVKIGDIHLTGSQSREEILKAIRQSQADNGLADYYDDLLNNGQLDEAIQHIKAHPDNLAVLLELMQERDIKISTQVGIGAIFEEMAGSDALEQQIPKLTELTRHKLGRVRNDACFFLSLTGKPEVTPTIETLLDDKDAEVRETAQDCLDELRDA